MKKSVYYRSIYGRQNRLLYWIDKIVIGISSYPRLVIEVFIRKNFGERYFNGASAVTVAVLLALIPKYGDSLNPFAAFSRYRSYDHSGSSGEFWGKFATWYLFTAAFAYFSYIRWREQKTSPGVFDFKRFSYHDGDRPLQDLLAKTNAFGWLNIRNYEIFIEPALAIAAGALLRSFGQALGSLLIICGVILYFYKVAVYRCGDNTIMDKIDEIICNEDLTDILMSKDGDVSENKFSVKGRKPKNPDLGKKLGDEFTVDAEFDD